METHYLSSKWTQKAYVLATTLAIAAVINLVLLLLIASLIHCDDSEQSQTPQQLRPIDFVRAPQKQPEAKPAESPPQEKNIVEASEPTPVKPKDSPPKPTPKQKTSKTAAKPITQSSRVAAPKLDVPLDGTGSSFAGVMGQDSRITAPPVKWDVEQKPEAPKSTPVTRRLVAVSRVMPSYPWKAKSLGIEGWVKLEVIVDTEGAVSQVTVIEDQPKEIFAEAAVQAIKQWRFKPAFVEGQAVEQRALQLMEFQLKK